MEVPKTPDTPEQARIKEGNLQPQVPWSAVDNWARLEAEWEIAKELME